ncbi:MAG: TetR/AcrR family transcriptional regulator [Kineosporiaceae bacterium]
MSGRAARVPPTGPRRHPRQARARQTVEFVLEAAAQLFAEAGYRATTTNHVAARAGVSVGTLYQYFPHKDALLLALAERHVTEGTTALRAVSTALRESGAGWQDVARTLVESVVALNASPLHVVLADQAPRTPELLALVAELHDAMAAEVTGHLVRLGRGGRHPDLRARLLVSAVDATVHEVVIRQPDRPAAVAELVAVCVRAAPPENDGVSSAP